MSRRSTRDKGRHGEERARAYLSGCGYRILRMNFQGRCGEIDIIAFDREDLVFIEVKSGDSQAFGDPLGWVPHWKQRRIVRASQEYTLKNDLFRAPQRFDVISVDPRGEVRHVRDAFRPSHDVFM